MDKNRVNISAFLLKILIGILIFLGVNTKSSILAQSYPQNSQSHSELRVPTKERLNEISEDKAYNYQEEKTELSLWDRLLIWLKNLLGDWVQNDYVEWFLKITAGIAFVLVLFLFINQISKGELKNALSKRHDRTILNLNFKSATQDTINLDDLLNAALEKKNYALGVRYLYQKSILILKERNLIHWKANKTNRDFLAELGSHPAATTFNRLTYFYEYVDYGDFNVDESRFHSIEKVFQQFKKTIQNNS